MDQCSETGYQPSFEHTAAFCYTFFTLQAATYTFKHFEPTTRTGSFVRSFA